MKKRCKKCGYKDTDKVYDKKQKKNIDLKQTIRCYRADKPDIELCPECKEEL